MDAIATASVTLASSVADDATFTLTYPSGITRAMIFGTTGGRIVVNDAVYSQGDPGFEFTANAADITVTNRSGASWAAGASVIVSFGRTSRNGTYLPTGGAELPRLPDGTVDLSWQELTASGAINPTVETVELNHASVVIAATLNLATVRNKTMIFKNTSASGTAAHTVTLTGGTFNGTATVATLNARDEMLVVHFDSAGRGNIIANIGAVALS